MKNAVYLFAANLTSLAMAIGSFYMVYLDHPDWWMALLGSFLTHQSFQIGSKDDDEK